MGHGHQCPAHITQSNWQRNCTDNDDSGYKQRSSNADSHQITIHHYASFCLYLITMILNSSSYNFSALIISGWGPGRPSPALTYGTFVPRTPYLDPTLDPLLPMTPEFGPPRCKNLALLLTIIKQKSQTEEVINGEGIPVLHYECMVSLPECNTSFV